jgi:hypothetical protein
VSWVMPFLQKSVGYSAGYARVWVMFVCGVYRYAQKYAKFQGSLTVVK